MRFLLLYCCLLLCTQRTAGFDLYMVLDPLISKSQAIVFGNKLIRWINVCERERVRFLARFLLRMRRYLPEAAAVILRAPLVIYALFFYVLFFTERRREADYDKLLHLLVYKIAPTNTFFAVCSCVCVCKIFQEF